MSIPTPLVHSPSCFFPALSRGQAESILRLAVGSTGEAQGDWTLLDTSTPSTAHRHYTLPTGTPPLTVAVPSNAVKGYFLVRKTSGGYVLSFASRLASNPVGHAQIVLHGNLTFSVGSDTQQFGSIHEFTRSWALSPISVARPTGEAERPPAGPVSPPPRRRPSMSIRPRSGPVRSLRMSVMIDERRAAAAALLQSTKQVYVRRNGQPKAPEPLLLDCHAPLAELTTKLAAAARLPSPLTEAYAVCSMPGRAWLSLHESLAMQGVAAGAELVVWPMSEVAKLTRGQVEASIVVSGFGHWCRSGNEAGSRRFVRAWFACAGQMLLVFQPPDVALFPDGPDASATPVYVVNLTLFEVSRSPEEATQVGELTLTQTSSGFGGGHEAAVRHVHAIRFSAADFSSRWIVDAATKVIPGYATSTSVYSGHDDQLTVPLLWRVAMKRFSRSTAQRVRFGASIAKVFHSQRWQSINYGFLPDVVDRCVEFLRSDQSLDTSNLFCTPGLKTKVAVMRDMYDAGYCLSFADPHDDPHDVANLLLTYLRELPEPVICRGQFGALLAAGSDVAAVRKCLLAMPFLHQVLLAYLLEFFGTLLEHAVNNGLSEKALGRVVGPVLCGSAAVNAGSPPSTLDAATLDQLRLAAQQITQASELFSVLLSERNALFSDLDLSLATRQGPVPERRAPPMPQLVEDGTGSSGSASPTPGGSQSRVERGLVAGKAAAAAAERLAHGALATAKRGRMRRNTDSPTPNRRVRFMTAATSSAPLDEDDGELGAVHELVQESSHSGVLMKRKRGRALGIAWQRRYFALHDGTLYYFADKHAPEPLGQFHLLTTAVKSTPAGLEKATFELWPAGGGTYDMRAESRADADAWYDAIRAQHEQCLFGSFEGAADTKQAGWRDELRAVAELPPNRACADCGADCGLDQWASVNLGVFICIECSGVHRALGVDVSQVRSVKLDEWTLSQVAVVKAVGNAKAALLWEAELDASGEARPKGLAAPRDERENFINAKYVLKRYYDKSQLTEDDFSRATGTEGAVMTAEEEYQSQQSLMAMRKSARRTLMLRQADTLGLINYGRVLTRSEAVTVQVAPLVEGLLRRLAELIVEARDGGTLDTLGSSPDYLAFCQETVGLQALSVGLPLLSEAEQCALWLNLYNLMFLHAFVEYGNGRETVQPNMLLYGLGDQVQVSLEMIVLDILRLPSPVAPRATHPWAVSRSTSSAWYALLLAPHPGPSRLFIVDRSGDNITHLAMTALGAFATATVERGGSAVTADSCSIPRALLNALGGASEPYVCDTMGADSPWSRALVQLVPPEVAQRVGWTATGPPRLHVLPPPAEGTVATFALDSLAR